MIPYDPQPLAQVCDSKLDVDSKRGLRFGRMGISEDQDIGRRFSVGEVGIHKKARGPWVASKDWCQNHWFLLLRNGQMAIGTDIERTLDRDQPYFRTVHIPHPSALGSERSLVIQAPHGQRTQSLGLIDLHRSTLDPIHPRRSAEQIGAADQYLAFSRQGNAGLAAFEHDLPVRTQQNPLIVDVRVHGFRCRSVAGWMLDEADHQWRSRVAALEQQRHLATDIGVRELGRGAGLECGLLGVAGKGHQWLAGIVKTEQNADDHAVDIFDPLCCQGRWSLCRCHV
jgi:hypothetical protein